MPQIPLVKIPSSLGDFGSQKYSNPIAYRGFGISAPLEAERERGLLASGNARNGAAAKERRRSPGSWPSSNFGGRSQGAFRHRAGYVNETYVSRRGASGTRIARAARSDRFRSAEVSSGVHVKRASGGGERWNYASVHLTECDESDRGSA